VTKSLETKQFHLGVCYYPEQWPENLWEDDYKRMRRLGFSIIRMGEFAWSKFEPHEGEFESSFFDRAVNLAHKHGLKVIFCTPTATPPVWLTHKYPEVLNVTKEGLQHQHGERRHYNYNSKIYREFSARIARRLAEHYKHHPAVIGWQIDNELNCHINSFYSNADHDAFREWAKQKYGTLEKLNDAWGTVVWNQTYTDWSQVYLTRPTPSNSPNPHQALDEKRFFSDSAISFCKLQADIIREIAPYQWITTNGLFGHLDSHKMTEQSLDFFSYDSYPNFATIYPDKGDKPLLDRKWSANLSIARSISSNFCVMEQQSGPGGWVNMMEMPSPKPGQMRLWTYQSIAHGADMILYFRWRTAVIGTEIYWHGINDYDNRPNRRVQEAERIGKELQNIGGSLVGSKYWAEAAIVRSYDNEWDGEMDRWHGPLESNSNAAWFKAFQRKHVPVDTVYMNGQTTLGELRKYKLLVYSHPTIVTDQIADILKQYVEQGGIVIFGCRSGYKDENGKCHMLRPLPGPLADLCGVEVADFTLIGPYQNAPKIRFINSKEQVEVHAEMFNDILKVVSKKAEVLAEYDEDYYKGSPALVRNAFGEGSAYYYGAAFSEAMANSMLDEVGLSSPLTDRVNLPEDIELSLRVDEQTGEQWVFLLNFAHSTQDVVFHQEAVDILSGRILKETIAMDPYEVFVINNFS
jgi:beta-galactosidase